MATAAVLEDAITCCICFNVYRDPHALPCLHTLCKPCIDQLAVNKKVECPECREMAKVGKIKKDFKTQKLIDDYKLKDDKSKDDVGIRMQSTDHLCGMCSNTKTPAVSHCKGWEHFMCDNCDKVHKGMKVCKGHSVRRVIDIIKTTLSKLEMGLNQWQQEMLWITKTSDETNDSINVVQHQRDSQIIQTNQHFDRLINALKKDRATMLKEIKEVNVERIKDLKRNVGVYTQISAEIQTKIDMLEEIIDKAHITTMIAMGESMADSLQIEINNIRQRVAAFAAQNVSPIHIFTDKNPYSSGIHLRKQCAGPLTSGAGYSKATKSKTTKHQVKKSYAMVTQSPKNK